MKKLYPNEEKSRKHIPREDPPVWHNTEMCTSVFSKILGDTAIDFKDRWLSTRQNASVNFESCMSPALFSMYGDNLMQEALDGTAGIWLEEKVLKKLFVQITGRYCLMVDACDIT